MVCDDFVGFESGQSYLGFFEHCRDQISVPDDSYNGCSKQALRFTILVGCDRVPTVADKLEGLLQGLSGREILLSRYESA